MRRVIVHTGSRLLGEGSYGVPRSFTLVRVSQVEVQKMPSRRLLKGSLSALSGKGFNRPNMKYLVRLPGGESEVTPPRLGLGEGLGSAYIL